MGGQFSAWGDKTRAEKNDVTEHTITFAVDERQAEVLLKLLRRVTLAFVAYMTLAAKPPLMLSP